MTFLMKRVNRYTEEFWADPSATIRAPRRQSKISLAATSPSCARRRRQTGQWIGARNQPLRSDDTPAVAIDST